MAKITKEHVAGIANGEKCYTHDDVLELAHIALASLEAEPVMYVMAGEDFDTEATSTSKAVVDGRVDEWDQVGDQSFRTVPFYAATLAPVPLTNSGREELQDYWKAAEFVTYPERLRL
ncbi:hypothetical protein [Enterobacter soli]|uniref:hypothetical protein n=1 Tax=Enterobacter soli TaxID=885040 RepID=UPI00404701AB